MVDVYVALIIKGLKTIDQVPLILKEKVELALLSQGLDVNGKELIV